MSEHGLTDAQLRILRGILSLYAGQIDRVGLFGSRATGKFRDNSDIDLVIYGPIDQPAIDRLWTLFDASALPIKVDVVAYDLIQHPPFKQHINSCMKPLFEKGELVESSSR